MSRVSDIQQRIRDDIVAGGLSFGARLRIDELATRYGVSHTPVREALRELSGEGLVVIERNRGASVCSVHLGTVEDLFDMRSAVEMMLARRAAERRTEAHLAKLAATERLLEERVAERDFPAVPGINRLFHGVINDAGATPARCRWWTATGCSRRRYGSATATKRRGFTA